MRTTTPYTFHKRERRNSDTAGWRLMQLSVYPASHFTTSYSFLFCYLTEKSAENGEATHTRVANPKLIHGIPSPHPIKFHSIPAAFGYVLASRITA